MGDSQLPETAHVLLRNAAAVPQHHGPQKPSLPPGEQPVHGPAHLMAQLYQHLPRGNRAVPLHSDALVLGEIGPSLEAVRQAGVPGGIKAASLLKGAEGHQAFHPVIGIAGKGHGGGEPQGEGPNRL